MSAIRSAMVFNSADQTDSDMVLQHRMFHDLKANLRALREIPGWLREDLPDAALSSEITEYLDLLDGNARSMERLVTRFRDLQMVPGLATAPDGWVSLADLAARVWNDLGGEDAGLALRIVDVVQVPNPAVGRILLEVFDNCRRYGGAERHGITLGAQQLGDQLHIHVDDHGPGIAPALRAKALAPLEMLQPKGVTDAVGLGLSIAARLAASLGGTIALTDTKEDGAEAEVGPGTRVEICIPAMP